MSRSRNYVLAGCVACIMLLGFIEPAFAEPDDDATSKVEALYLEGVVMYRAGKYDGAISKFRDAYKIFPDPKLLYNIGRCYEAKGTVDEAASYYRRCVEHPEVDDDVRKKSIKRIKVLERARKLGTPAKPGETTTTQTGSTPTQTGGTAVTQRQPGTAPAEPPKSSSAWVNWVTAVVGGAGIIAGSTLLMVGVSKQSEVEDAKSAASDSGSVAMTRTEALDIQDKANQLKIFGYVAIGIGVASAIASTTLFILDARRSSDERPDAKNAQSSHGLSYAFVPAHNGGAFALGGTF